MSALAAHRRVLVAVCALTLAFVAMHGADEAHATSPWISSASSMTCARDASNQMVCWGGKGLPNTAVMRGLGSYTGDGAATIVSGLDARQVAIGYDHTCAIIGSGLVKCWGLRTNGQLGDTQTAGSESSPTTFPLPGGATAIGIAVTTSGTCAVTSTNRLYCAGAKANVGSPAGAPTEITTPVDVGLVGVEEVAMGPSHGCARLSNSRVTCWGTGTNGQLGDGGSVTSATPVNVDKIGVNFSITDLPGATDIAVGNRHSCAVLTDKRVACWGFNASGQIGDGTLVSRAQPTIVSGLTDAVEVAAGGSMTCARRLTGAVVCWGINADGSLGTGSFTPAYSATPVTVFTVEDAAGISVGGISGSSAEATACAMRLNGTVACWGPNTNGELGKTGSATSTPGTVPLVDGPAAPSAPTITSAVIDDRSIAVSWTPSPDATWSVTGYTATAGPDGGSCSTDGTSSSCTLTGLRNGAEYDVTVAATNELGAGPASTALRRVPGVVPSAPSSVVGVRVRSGARISWAAADGLGNAVRQYQAKAAQGPECTAAFPSTVCVMADLAIGVAYEVRVRARNDMGWGPWSSPTTLPTIRPPGAPTVGAILASDATITVGWKPGANNGAPITEYQACASPGELSDAEAPWAKACASGGQRTCTLTSDDPMRACTLTGLENGTRYRIVVRARNDEGWSKPSSGRTTAVPTISGTRPSVTADGRASIAVRCVSAATCRGRMRVRIPIAPFALSSVAFRVPAQATGNVEFALPGALQSLLSQGDRLPGRVSTTMKTGRATSTELIELAAPPAAAVVGPSHVRGLFTTSVSVEARCVGTRLQRCAGYFQLAPEGAASSAYGQTRFSVRAGSIIRAEVAITEKAAALVVQRGHLDARPHFAMYGGTAAPDIHAVRLWNVTPSDYERAVDRVVTMQRRPEFMRLVTTVWTFPGQIGVNRFRDVLSSQQQALTAANALPRSSPNLNRARALLIRSARIQIRAGNQYLAWFEGGPLTVQRSAAADDRTARALRRRAVNLVGQEIILAAASRSGVNHSAATG